MNRKQTLSISSQLNLAELYPVVLVDPEMNVLAEVQVNVKGEIPNYADGIDPTISTDQCECSASKNCN